VKAIRYLNWAAVAAIAVLAVVLVAGCASDDDEQATAAGNATDRAFAQAMIPHHQGAVEMAELAQRKARHPELGKMASEVIAAQTAEIMTLRRVDRELPRAGVETGELGMDEHMMGVDAEMGTLRDTRPFDRAFIDMMTPHHEGAIRMARVELRRGRNPQLRRMARAIIAGQTREIEQMATWRKAWFGSAGSAMPGGEGHGDHM
jgi:uncharacterized protein (DUF305 family)